MFVTPDYAKKNTRVHPHHNILERYYGKDWKPVPQEGLEDHY